MLKIFKNTKIAFFILFSFFYAFLFLFSYDILALPDSEVQQLKKESSAFKKSEERILLVWDNLPKDIRNSVRNEQIQWIKTERDKDAEKYMSQGDSKADAYAKATDDRSNYLESLVNGSASSSASSSSSNTASSSDSSSSSSSSSSSPENTYKMTYTCKFSCAGYNFTSENYPIFEVDTRETTLDEAKTYLYKEYNSICNLYPGDENEIEIAYVGEFECEKW
jgi:hypothetical protein